MYNNNNFLITPKLILLVMLLVSISAEAIHDVHTTCTSNQTLNEDSVASTWYWVRKDAYAHYRSSEGLVIINFSSVPGSSPYEVMSRSTGVCFKGYVDVFWRIVDFNATHIVLSFNVSIHRLTPAYNCFRLNETIDIPQVISRTVTYVVDKKDLELYTIDGKRVGFWYWFLNQGYLVNNTSINVYHGNCSNYGLAMSLNVPNTTKEYISNVCYRFTTYVPLKLAITEYSGIIELMTEYGLTVNLSEVARYLGINPSRIVTYIGSYNIMYYDRVSGLLLELRVGHLNPYIDDPLHYAVNLSGLQGLTRVENGSIKYYPLVLRLSDTNIELSRPVFGAVTTNSEASGDTALLTVYSAIAIITLIVVVVLVYRRIRR